MQRLQELSAWGACSSDILVFGLLHHGGIHVAVVSVAPFLFPFSQAKRS